MNVRLLRACVLVGSVAILATWGAARADDGPVDTFAQGGALLQKGDFEGAFEAFTAAAKADPDNQEYRQQAALIRRVIALRGRLDQEQDADRWVRMATSLHGFYHQHNIHSEALLALGQQIHARLSNAESAAMLARTQLALNKDSAAASLLKELRADQVTPEVEALLGVALARQGKLEEAGALAEDLELPEDAAPQLLFDVACLQAKIGNTEQALTLLRRSFELTPPSRLAAAKAAAQESPDLVGLKESEAFAAALKTESQVKESGCSGGTSCGKCPSNMKCASKSGKSKDNESSCPERSKDKKPEKP